MSNSKVTFIPLDANELNAIKNIVSSANGIFGEIENWKKKKDCINIVNKNSLW